MRVRQSVAKLFAAWALWSRTIFAVKSRSVNHTCRSCAKPFTSWRLLALWRIHVDAALKRSLAGWSSKLNSEGAEDMKSKVSELATSVVYIMFPDRLEWPSMSMINRAINHQRFWFPSLSTDAFFDACVFSGPPKQTLKSLFHKARSSCIVSRFFRSWHGLLMHGKDEYRKEPSVLDGDVTEVIAGACVSLGRSQPLLLGYCALKVRDYLCSCHPCSFIHALHLCRV